jgi:PAS domain S-box-containing protein
VNSSSEAIIGRTLDGIVCSWNQSAERIFGYSAEEAIGKPLSMLYPAGSEAEELDIQARLDRGKRSTRTTRYEGEKTGRTSMFP